jgi:hypothetical protein
VKVEVRLLATLARYLPPGTSREGVVLDLPAGTTVGAALRALGVPPDVDCLCVVNGRDAEPHAPLRDGDVVTLCPPLVGGL